MNTSEHALALNCLTQLIKIANKYVRNITMESVMLDETVEINSFILQFLFKTLKNLTILVARRLCG